MTDVLREMLGDLDVKTELKQGGDEDKSAPVSHRATGRGRQKTHLLDELHKHELAPSVRSEQLDLLCLTLPVRLEVEDFDGLVNRLLRHRPVRRPLSSSDSEQAGLGDVDQVVPDERLGVLRVGVSDERSESRPGGEDVSTADLNLRREVVLDLVENPLDLRLLGDGILVEGGGGVGCSCSGGTEVSEWMNGRTRRGDEPAITTPCQGRKKMTRPSDVAGSRRPMVLGPK